MSAVTAPPLRRVRGWGVAAGLALRTVGIVVMILIVVQSLIVVQARPQDLVTGFHGMVDIVSRATPPDFSKLPDVAWPTLETIDIAIFGTLGDIKGKVKESKITRTALILVGHALGDRKGAESRLYAPDHYHLMRPRRELRGLERDDF